MHTNDPPRMLSHTMAFRFQFSLRFFLIVMILSGTVIGLSARSIHHNRLKMDLRSRYVTQYERIRIAIEEIRGAVERDVLKQKDLELVADEKHSQPKQILEKGWTSQLEWHVQRKITLTLGKKSVDYIDSSARVVNLRIEGKRPDQHLEKVVLHDLKGEKNVLVINHLKKLFEKQGWVLDVR